MEKQQNIQEAQYNFPYHHIPKYENGNFSLTRSLRWGCEYISYINFVLRKIKLLQFEKLLDVGCGDGRLLYEISKYFPNKKLVGIDISLRSIKFAEAFNFKQNIEFVCGDITGQALSKRKFDVVTLMETLEHIQPDIITRFVKGIHFYLKKGGSLLITVPSKNFKLKPQHYQHFDLELLNKVLYPYFSISEYCFINKLSILRNLVELLFANRFFILNNQYILNMIFHFYEKNFLLANADNAQRIFLFCKKNNHP